MSKKSNILSAGRPSARKDKATTLASLSDKPITKRVNFELDIEQHKKLKVYASSQGKSIKEVLVTHIEQLIN